MPGPGVGEGVDPSVGAILVSAEGVGPAFETVGASSTKGPPSAHTFPSVRQVSFTEASTAFPFFEITSRDIFSVTDFDPAGSKLPMVQDTTPFDHFQLSTEGAVQDVRPAEPELPEPAPGVASKASLEAFEGWGVAVSTGDGFGVGEPVRELTEAPTEAEGFAPFPDKGAVSVTGKYPLGSVACSETSESGLPPSLAKEKTAFQTGGSASFAMEEVAANLMSAEERMPPGWYLRMVPFWPTAKPRLFFANTTAFMDGLPTTGDCWFQRLPS